MNFGTDFLVDNPKRPDFDEHDANHHPNFDFESIEIGMRGIISFKESDDIFSNFEVVVIDKDQWTVTTKLNVSDLDPIKSVTYHKTEIYHFEGA